MWKFRNPFRKENRRETKFRKFQKRQFEFNCLSERIKNLREISWGNIFIIRELVKKEIDKLIKEKEKF